MVAQRTFEEEPPREGEERREWTVSRREARVLSAQLRAVRVAPEEVPERWAPSPDEVRDAQQLLRGSREDAEGREQRRTLWGALVAAAVLHFVAGPALLPSLYSEGDVLKRMAQNTLAPPPVQVVVWTAPEESAPEPPPVAESVTQVEAPPVVKKTRPAASKRKARRTASRTTSAEKPKRKTVVAGNAEVSPVVSNEASGVEVAGSGDAVTGPESTSDAPAESAAVAGPGPDLDALFASYVNRVGRDVQRDFRYPRALLRAGVEGTVIIEILVDESGQIHGYKVASSSGSRQLDRAALKAMKSISAVSAPPAGLKWAKRSIRVPFVYRLKRSA